MVIILSLILSIAIALSMDAFSIALSLSIYKNNIIDYYKYSILVGIMHFIMPLLGSLTGMMIFNKIIVNSNKLMGVILLILAIDLLYNVIKKEELIKEISFKTILFLAFSVSIDSYFTGIGLYKITSNLYSSFLIFSGISFMFSISGCYIGLLGKKYLGKISNILALIILILLSVKFLLF